MTFFISVLSFILVFVIVALAHELGHFIWAKRAGIKVLEFGIGFGPVIFKKEHKGTVYSINLIPILAFVRLAGIDEQEDEKGVPLEQQYASKSPAEKFKSIIAGPLMNLFLGFIIYSLLAMTFGLPHTGGIVVNKVLNNSPAQKAGFLEGDKIVLINGDKVSDITSVINRIQKSPGKTVSLKIVRAEKELLINAVPEYNEKEKAGLLGFSLSPQISYKTFSPLESVFQGAKQTLYVSYKIVETLALLFTGQINLKMLAGPIGIAKFSGQAAMLGLPTFLNWLALISINLAIFNLLPIPALDGGRLVFILIEAFRKKPINIEMENRIHQWGLVALLAFFVVVSFNDIWRLFSK